MLEMYFKKRSLEEYRHEIVDTYYHTTCINTYISLTSSMLLSDSRFEF